MKKSRRYEITFRKLKKNCKSLKTICGYDGCWKIDQKCSEKNCPILKNCKAVMDPNLFQSLFINKKV